MEKRPLWLFFFFWMVYALVLAPKDSFSYALGYHLSYWPLVLIKKWIAGEWPIYDACAHYCLHRKFSRIITFAYWAFFVGLIVPFVVHRAIWRYGLWVDEIDGTRFSRTYWYTNFEFETETTYEDYFYTSFFWVNTVMFERWYYSYWERVEISTRLIAWVDKYRFLHPSGNFILGYGNWDLPRGGSRIDWVLFWKDRLEDLCDYGRASGAFKPTHIAIHDRCWQGQGQSGMVRLVSDGHYHGHLGPALWLQWFFSELLYTLAYRAHYWGECNDPFYHHWSLAVSNKYTDGTPRLSWRKTGPEYYQHVDFLEVIWNRIVLVDNLKNHRFLNPAFIPDVIKGHSIYRRVCFEQGLPIDYTDFVPDYFFTKCLKDDTSWFYFFGKWCQMRGEHVKYNMSNDIDFCGWALNPSRTFPNHYYNYYKNLHNYRGLTDFSDDHSKYTGFPIRHVSPSTVISDLKEDLVVLYEDRLSIF